MLVSGSFLSDEIKPVKAISMLENANVDYIHVDVMDGKFVQNKSYTLSEIESFSKLTNISFDVHLMVKNPEKYIDSLSMLNVEYITFHYEAVKDCVSLINHIKNNGVKVGISIKPETLVSNIFPLLNLVDLVLIMSVEPGKSGQKFMDSVIYKIDVLRHELEEKNYNVLISVDGGINDETFSKVKEKVDMVVSSSYLLSGDSLNKVEYFKNS